MLTNAIFLPNSTPTCLWLPRTNFYFINRKEYLDGNPFLRWYFDQPNIKCGIYADLQRWVDGHRDDIKWKLL